VHPRELPGVGESGFGEAGCQTPLLMYLEKVFVGNCLSSFLSFLSFVFLDQRFEYSCSFWLSDQICFSRS
jgi:hypothetical protein